MSSYFWIAAVLCAAYFMIDSYVYKYCYFICDKCGTSFKPAYLSFVFTQRRFLKYKRIKCPHCTHHDFMETLIKKDNSV
jgi:transcription elongation factor Elf1